MKANELRIGNWILIPYQNSPIAIPAHETQVQGITIFGEILTNNTPEHEGLKTHYNHVSGIPLTEKWLLKFGFSDNGAPEWVRDLSNYNIGNDTIQYIKNDSWKCIKIRYVHQLQNLYFALTGTELNLK